MLPQSSIREAQWWAKYGALSGLVATWAISTAIAASEIELGLAVGTFYAVMGMSLGAGGFMPAAYMGFGLHLVTGALLGMVIGLAMSRLVRAGMLNPYRAVLAGMCAGMAVWLVLFLPLTTLIVQPSLSETGTLFAAGFAQGTGQLVLGIALSAIAFHLVWGAIFGYMSSAFLRIKAFKMSRLEEDMQK
jgi:hypothetical protein